MPDDLHARRERLHAAAEEYRAKTSELGRRVRDITARANSRDDLVEVEVGQGGALRDLVIDRGAYRVYGPDALAALIRRLADTAAGAVAERTAAEFGRVFGIKVTAGQLRTGEVTLTELADAARRKYFD